MNKTKITMGFGKMSDDALEGYTASIVASMTGNKNFPDVNPSLATCNSCQQGLLRRVDTSQNKASYQRRG